MNGTATPPDDQAPPPPPLPPPPGDSAPPPAAAETRPIFGGVCAYLGDRLGVDATWIRIGFVVASLADGLGLIVYAALWLILIAGRPQRSAALAILGSLLLLFGLPVVAGGLLLSGPLVTIFLLIGLAVALWQPRRDTNQPAGPPAQNLGAFPHTRATASQSTATPPSPRTVPRESSPLGAITLGSAMVVAAAGALIDQANGGRLHPEQWLGAAAIVCGIGLLVGTVRGHGRWLIIPALVISGLGALGGQMAQLGIGTGDLTGDRWIGISEGSPRHYSERVALGRIHISVDRVPQQPVTVDARVAMGDISLTVEDHVAVDLVRDGRGAPERIGRADGAADVTVVARNGYGRVNTSTYTSGDPFPEFSEFEESLGQLRQVAEGVQVTNDGWFVLGDGEVVIDDHDEVVHGEGIEEGEGVTLFYSYLGDFRLLPRGLLMTPWNEVIDLQTIRAEVADGEKPSTTTIVADATIPGSEGDQP